jgi:hypothetical protein
MYDILSYQTRLENTMSSIFDISGNNLPELTSTSSPQEFVQFFRVLIARKRNEYAEPEQFAAGYNRAIEELMSEVDRLELKQNFSANTAAIAEFNRVFRTAVA